MGLFGNKKAKLPSYVGVGLEALLQDREWADAISQSGINPTACEIVLRLADPQVWTGILGGENSAKPAILFGQGSTLAIAFPAEREVRIVRRNREAAQLQTQGSGWFQILFGPVETLDGFYFYGSEDNLMLNTPEGQKFGQIMSAFLNGQLKPQQIIGTPQSLVSGGVSVEPPAPAFEDPEDALRWKMVHTLQSTLTEAIDKNTQCFEKAQSAEKAFAMANRAGEHEISRANIYKVGVADEQELVVLLHELRELTHAAQSQWNDLLLRLPAADSDLLQIENWCMSNGVEPEVLSSVVTGGVFINTDFGLTRESFWTENDRLAEVFKGTGQ
jgi:hypothetical protein